MALLEALHARWVRLLRALTPDQRARRYLARLYRELALSDEAELIESSFGSCFAMPTPITPSGSSCRPSKAQVSVRLSTALPDACSGYM